MSLAFPLLPPVRCTFVVQGTSGGPLTPQPVALPQGQPILQELAAAEVSIDFGVQFTPWLDPTDSLLEIVSVTVAENGASYGQDVATPALFIGASLWPLDRGTVIVTLGDGATAQPGHAYHVTCRVRTASTQVLETRTSSIICPF